jgi:hypothetical protein
VGQVEPYELAIQCVIASMTNRIVLFSYLNPDLVAATADYILKILIEENSQKVEKAIQEASNQILGEAECDEEHLI